MAQTVVQVWQRNPDQLAGWFPRLTTTAGSGSAVYLSKLQTLLLHAEYDTILTKGAIMHGKYLRAYSEVMPAAVRDMVAERRNCEDLAMQHLVSSMTGEAPHFVWDPRCASST